jgi:hypothetical protein
LYARARDGGPQHAFDGILLEAGHACLHLGAVRVPVSETDCIIEDEKGL